MVRMSTSIQKHEKQRVPLRGYRWVLASVSSHIMKSEGADPKNVQRMKGYWPRLSILSKVLWMLDNHGLTSTILLVRTLHRDCGSL